MGNGDPPQELPRLTKPWDRQSAEDFVRGLLGTRGTGSTPTDRDRGLVLKRPTMPGQTPAPDQDRLRSPWLESPPLKHELGFTDAVVADRDKRFAGRSGTKLKALVASTATKAELDPGFLAANMLAEHDNTAHWLGDSASDFAGNLGTGADSFSDLIARNPDGSLKESREGLLQIRSDVLRKIPAARGLHLKGPTKPLGAREYSPVYPPGNERALLFAVYIKWKEFRVRQLLAAGGKNFDDYPDEFRFAVTRLAVNPGSHKSQTIESRIAVFLQSGDPNTIVVRSGTEAQSQQAIARAATRVAAQAIHLSQTVFGRARQ